MKHRIQGNTLLSMMAALAIIAILSVGFMVGFGPKAGQSARKDGLGKTIPGAAKLKAEDVVCQSNISQARQLVMVAQQGSDDNPPATLDEVPGIKSVNSCPIGHEPYTYDPKTGKVSCPHPGHENY